MSVAANLDMIEAYDRVLAVLEQEIIGSAKEHDPTAYALLKSIPGVGKINALNLLNSSGSVICIIFSVSKQAEY